MRGDVWLWHETDMPFKQGHFRSLCSSSDRDIVETLKGWGVLRSGVSVP